MTTARKTMTTAQRISDEELAARIKAVDSTKVTLDGIPAIICGIHSRFPIVAQLEYPFATAEFCWPTVHRIMANGGNFRI